MLTLIDWWMVRGLHTKYTNITPFIIIYPKKRKPHRNNEACKIPISNNPTCENKRNFDEIETCKYLCNTHTQHCKIMLHALLQVELNSPPKF